MSRNPLFLGDWKKFEMNRIFRVNMKDSVRMWMNNLRNHIIKGQKRKQRNPGGIFKVANTQCNVYIAQRLRKLHQIYSLYQKAYNDFANLILFYPFLRYFLSPRRAWLLLGASVFRWEENGISEGELQKQIDDLKLVQDILKIDGEKAIQLPKSWVNLLYNDDIKMWEYPNHDTGMMEYKVYGTFNDITAKTFFNIQLDINYRKQWDKLVIKAAVIDEDPERNEQVLQWVSYYPYPLSPREYICTRRTRIDEENKIMVISARSVTHPKTPPCKNCVQVTSYVSHMVIKPHRSFDEEGFDYLLTYSDDPRTVLPTRFASWAVTSGIPNYIEKLHNACLQFCKGKSNAGI